MTSSTGKIIDSAAHGKDKNQKAQDISKELENMSKNVNDSVKDGWQADTDVEKIQVLEEKVKKMEEGYKDMLSKEELDVYDRMDNKGKLEMLAKKKEIDDHAKEVAKNQAIIDAENKKKAAAEELDNQLKKEMLKTLKGDSGEKK